MFSKTAIPFISLNGDDETYEVSNEAKELFESVDGPFGIISIVGKYRTGKSFFLNHCLLSSSVAAPAKRGNSSSSQTGGGSGFQVGNTVQACTKGLWIYATPIYNLVEDSHGNTMPVFVIDTEGIGALDATNTHDTRIFALALLMSSFFIYNSLNAIDEEALNQLSLVTNICKQIRISSDKDATPEELGKEVFPPLLWMVRDFSLQLKNEYGHNMLPNEYLEQALKDSSNEDKNQLRRCLRACFPNRTCATIVRPCNDENDLQFLRTLSLGHSAASNSSNHNNNNGGSCLKQNFVQQINALRKFILTYVQPKKAGSSLPMNGKSFIAFAQTIVDSINQGTAPVIRDSWSLISEIQCRDAVQQIYQTVYVPLVADIMNRIHNMSECGVGSGDSASSENAGLSSFSVDQLLSMHSQAKRTTMDRFRNGCETYIIQKSSGANMRKWEDSLTERMDQDKQRIMEEFKRLSESNILRKLSEFDEAIMMTQQHMKSQNLQNQQQQQYKSPIPSVQDLQMYEDQFSQLIEPFVQPQQQQQKQPQQYHDSSSSNQTDLMIKTILLHFSKKSWKWLKHISSNSNSFESIMHNIEEERNKLREHLDKERSEIKEELEREHEKYRALQEKLSELNETLSTSLADKDAQLKIANDNIEDLEEQLRRWTDEDDTTSDIIITLKQHQPQQNNVNSINDIGIESYTTANHNDPQHRLIDEIEDLRRQLLESRNTSIHELRELREESNRSIQHTKDLYEENIKKKENEIDCLKRQMELLESQSKNKTNQIDVLQEKLRALDDKFRQSEANYLKMVESIQTGFFKELSQNKALYNDLQQTRMNEQIGWLERMRASDTKCAAAEGKSSELKRKLEQISDPLKFKRLKSNNVALSQKNAQLETSIKHLNDDLCRMREAYEKVSNEHKHMVTEYHNLKYANEIIIHKQTLEHAQQLAAMNNKSSSSSNTIK